MRLASQISSGEHCRRRGSLTSKDLGWPENSERVERRAGSTVHGVVSIHGCSFRVLNSNRDRLFRKVSPPDLPLSY